MFKGIEKEKPIGTLLMAMQAAGRTWIDGEKSGEGAGILLRQRRPIANGYTKKRRRTRCPAFFVRTVRTLKSFNRNKWDAIINLVLVRERLPELRAGRSTLNSTLADAAEEIEADLSFVWPFEGAHPSLVWPTRFYYYQLLFACLKYAEVRS